MSILGDMDELDREGSGEVGFKRHLLAPGLILTAAEILLVALPLWSMFDLGDADASVLWRVAIPVLAGVSILWIAALAAWLTPIQRAIQLRRRGRRLPKELAERAYRATLRIPLRALLLRTLLWSLSALAIGGFLVRYADWPTHRVAQIASLAALHAFAVNIARAIWFAGILSKIRLRLFSGLSRLRRFRDGYFGRFVLVALVVCGGTLAAVAAFLYYFVPIGLEQYLGLQTYYPAALGVGLVVWALLARRMSRVIEQYIERADEAGRAIPTEGPTAKAVYRRAQAMPYRLAMTTLGIWLVIIAIGAWVARAQLRVNMDDTVLIAGVAALIAMGASIYESLWHRDTTRLLLGHLTVRHGLRVHDLRPSMSLRTKLLLSFGGVVFLACGLALLWGFIQYKNLVTESAAKQAQDRLELLRQQVTSEVNAARDMDAPSNEWVGSILSRPKPQLTDGGAIVYYQPDTLSNSLFTQRVGSDEVEVLPWYVRAQLMLPYDDAVTLGAASLTGRHGRLVVEWGDGNQRAVHDLGSIAVLFPTYIERDDETVQPLKELLAFFVVLFGACAGIVLITVGQFVKPIRKLERRANGMAQGELAEPVSSGGEGDEIGRLTFALEEMRRALREKLRSTEEVNIELERRVTRRTADLAKKNRELAETLGKLTRAQDQLVRSEKMASIGQLVAGIAHEINNPVNAIVNTVGPLEEAIGYIDSEVPAEREEAATDVRDMVRVIQRGAERTKAIVQALHNYSRTDDENVVDFDLNRGLDDSLELLRHLLKQNITVARDYGEVGRIRGHAGKLNQVFMNLLTNAAQAVAGRDDAVIRVETRGENGTVEIVIADNGDGIPPEVLPRIFDPFFTTKDVGEGTGLGLSIVHELVERHGGTIAVDSEVGRGTTFTVTLPRTPEQAVPGLG